MTPSARVEIGNRGGFRTGILYTELGPLLDDLHGQGKTAIAYAVGTRTVVGEATPLGWWARDAAPLQDTGPRNP